MDMSRKACTRLNRLRTGVGRFNASMHKWGLTGSPACVCGASEQTADHLIAGCPALSPQEGERGLIDLTAPTREWLVNLGADI